MSFVDTVAPAHLSLDGLQLLIGAIIEQAVLDYRMLESKGLVKAGHVVKDGYSNYTQGRTGKKWEFGSNLRLASREINQLLAFLWQDIDALIAIAHFGQMTPDAIRNRLNFKGEPS